MDWCPSIDGFNSCCCNVGQGLRSNLQAWTPVSNCERTHLGFPASLFPAEAFTSSGNPVGSPGATGGERTHFCRCPGGPSKWTACPREKARSRPRLIKEGSSTSRCSHRSTLPGHGWSRGTPRSHREAQCSLADGGKQGPHEVMELGETVVLSGSSHGGPAWGTDCPH